MPSDSNSCWSYHPVTLAREIQTLWHVGHDQETGGQSNARGHARGVRETQER